MVFPSVALKSDTEGFSPFFPGDEDYKGALASVIRLQQTYLLSTTDLARGHVLGGPNAHSVEAPPLSQKACFDLAQAALSVGDPYIARGWYLAAQSNPVPPFVPPAWVLFGLAQLEAAVCAFWSYYHYLTAVATLLYVKSGALSRGVFSIRYDLYCKSSIFDMSQYVSQTYSLSDLQKKG